uniref:NADH dehydrogenase [ubiquinone] 1 beta subcomplex subunit 6 n=1 Tax=Syphacia muris TaxID=451379 RepID=A0A0N5AFD7_9BILA
MGNQYHKPARVGDYPYTRTGLPPPPTVKKAGSDAPFHKIHDAMSLELHMGDERVRASGLTPAEKEWRIKWVKDQRLHPDEPIHVDAVYRQLNPIRRIYRWPLDKLYVHYLRPTFGPYKAAIIRVLTPKILMIAFGAELLYYYLKYEARDWEHIRGPEWLNYKHIVTRKKEIQEIDPNLLELGIADPAKDRYYSPSWDKRTAYLDVGETSRPW